MNDQQLRDLIDDVRGGRTEDEFTDWKRKWWDLAAPASQDEFVKDIGALANALSDATRPRYVVLGLDPDGTLHPAPLPRDEAAIQQLLQARIEPTPTVRFTLRAVNGVAVTVVEILPPFDPPYVCKAGVQYRVWVRLGSSTGTATRRHLDRMYETNGASRRPSLVVGWAIEPLVLDRDGESEITPVPPPEQGFGGAITLRAPNVASFQELACDPASALADLEEARAAGETFDPEEEGAYHEALVARARWFSEPEQARSYYLWDRRGLGCGLRLALTNRGTVPATRVRLSIDLPGWLAVLEHPPTRPMNGPPDADPPMSHKEKEQIERMKQHFTFDLDATGPYAQMAAVMRSLSMVHAVPLITALPAISRADPMEALRSQWSWSASLEGARLVVTVPEVLQDHEECDEEPWFVLPLPGAPPGRHRIRYELFHAELDRHVSGGLEIIIQ